MHFVAVARERARLKRSLEGHFSRAMMKRLARRADFFEHPAETRVLSIIVCRIRGFAELAEKFIDDADALARLSRHTMTPMVQAVLEREGTIERLGPGELVAFFNAPLDDPKHAVHACASAIAMMEELEKVNHTLEASLAARGNFAPVNIGIGINTGEAIAGNFGTDEQPAYTVTGRAARLASDIERMTASYGTAILVAGATRTMAEKNFAFLEVDHVALDANEPLPLYSLLGTPLSRANPKFMALKAFHDRIFEAYRAREWEKARALIAQARALSGANPVLYDLYLQRIAHFETHPPGGNWSGVYAQILG